MKIIAYILAFAIGFLTLQPAAQHPCMGVTHYAALPSCCKEKLAHSTKKESGNCCDNGVCNPFGMCNCCSINNPERSLVFFISATINTFNAYADNKFTSSYLADCFHPPEIISSIKSVEII